ncbi:hypothetical protein [Brevibacillus sp. 179-C9.3 HS]|uniref:phosphoribosyltransferase-like protein n=1 Tax=unclassified Brevibacillus TaxID=2684853 RepID=UPI0039A3E275
MELSAAKRREIIQSIVNTVQDYRADAITFDNNHVERWVKQFDESVQNVLLIEMEHVLKQYYVNYNTACEHLKEIMEHKDLCDWDGQGSFSNVKLLNIQRNGNSQKELLSIFNDLMTEKYGVGIEKTGDKPLKYIYLDDCLFSGNTAIYDIIDWLPNAEPNTELHFVFLAIYTNGSRYVSRRLASELKKKNISVKFWRIHELNNIPWEGGSFDCCWPSQLEGNPQLDLFIEDINKRCEGKDFQPRIFKNRAFREEKIFTCSEHRIIVEKALLDAGVKIRNFSDSPKHEMRPLGYEKLESLGFGAMFFTFRNVANNCPLAIWWGDPEADDNHPLARWYPLLQRKVNSEVLDFSFLFSN